MSITYLERLATLGTGRRPVESARRERRRLIVYPYGVAFCDLLRLPGGESSIDYFVGYEPANWTAPGMIRIGLRLLWRLARVMPHCDGIYLYRCSERRDSVGTLLTAIFARLAGKPVTLYDYAFLSTPTRKCTGRLYSLARQVVIGDTSAGADRYDTGAPISFRIDPGDLGCYRAFAKRQAVPKVLVYGDFEDARIRSLVSRVYNLVKQKYPRTEFFEVSLIDIDDRPETGNHHNGTPMLFTPLTEEELIELFASADMLMLVSPGGINRYFISRARAAGYPILVNGLDFPEAADRESGYITVPGDSYSSLADEVISLVDDDAYYRRFNSPSREQD